MEISNSQSEHEDDMPVNQMTSHDLNIGGHSRSHRQIFGQGGGGPAFPNQQLVLLSLGLLNAALLIAALVIGIYCSKAPDYVQMTHSAIAPLIIERNFLRNQTDVIRIKVMDKAALVRERTNTAQLQLQVKQEIAVCDRRQDQIEVLRNERSNLQVNKTSLEKTCGRCQPNWILSTSSCYFYSYSESSQKKNWQESRADCIRRGGDLLTINSTQQHQEILLNYPRVPSFGTWWQNGFWVGLTDKAIPNVWTWINNATEVRKLYWRFGQPSSTPPQTGHCAAIHPVSYSLNMLYNAGCENQQLYWICEKQAS